MRPGEVRRNLMLVAAERWRDAGRAHCDEVRAVSVRRLPLPLPVLVALAAVAALVALHLVVG